LSAALNVTVDTVAPAAPVVASVSDDTGSNGSDAITSDNTLVLHGSAETHSTVELFRDGVSIGSTPADAAGAWSFDYSGTALTDGTYLFRARAPDAAGTPSVLSTALSVTVDTVSPAVTVDILDSTLNGDDNSSVVTFKFSELPIGFSDDDVTVVGGSLSAV